MTNLTNDLNNKMKISTLPPLSPSPSPSPSPQRQSLLPPELVGYITPLATTSSFSYAHAANIAAAAAGTSISLPPIQHGYVTPLLRFNFVNRPIVSKTLQEKWEATVREQRAWNETAIRRRSLKRRLFDNSDGEEEE